MFLRRYERRCGGRRRTNGALVDSVRTGRGRGSRICGLQETGISAMIAFHAGVIAVPMVEFNSRLGQPSKGGLLSRTKRSKR